MVESLNNFYVYAQELFISTKIMWKAVSKYWHKIVLYSGSFH